MRAGVRIKAVLISAFAATIAGGLLAGPALAAPAAQTAGSTAAASPAAPRLSISTMNADRKLHDIAAATLSTITGEARSASGAPLRGICVTASAPELKRSAVTGQDGRFAISGLRPGSYQVQYRGCAGAGQPYRPEWQGGVFGRGQSQPVVVTGSTLAPVQAVAPVTMYPADTSAGSLPGQVVRQHGADQRASDPFGRVAGGAASPADLIGSVLRHDGVRLGAATADRAVSSHGGRIAGVVTSPAGHGLKGICVEAVARRGAGFSHVVTSKTGSYRTARLPAGKYVVLFFAQCGNDGNWLFQIYKNIYNPEKTPTWVSVTAAKTTRISTVMKEGGEISGTVTGSGGKRLSGICVFPLTNSAAGLLVTDAQSRDGSYHIRSLPPGRYQVGFDSCGSSEYAPTLWPGTQNYSKARYVKISGASEVRDINQVMPVGGVISGTVSAATTPATPLAGICVYVSENNGLQQEGNATTSADGGYRITGLAAGSYSVQFQTGCGNNGNYVSVSYPANVAVTNGVTSAGIDGSLPVGATISGTVTSAATGKPIAGICVEIEDAQNGLEASEPTSAAGTYSVDQLPVGTYQALFAGQCGNRGSYAPQAYDDTNPLEPQNISVTAAGQNVTGISAALQPGPVIAGRVTSTSGAPLSGICVFAATPSGVLFGQGQSRDGRYSIPDLAPGLYQVVFAPGCGNNADLAEQSFRSSVTSADPVSAVSGTVTGINAVMQPAGAISGVVRAASGHRVPLSCIILTGISGAARSLTGEVLLFGSSYTISGLPLGGWQLTFAPSCSYSKLDTQWYRHKPTPAGAATVRVSAFHTTSGIDSALLTGGSIAGHVASAGTAVRNMCVYAQNLAEPDDFGLGVTGPRGNYVITGLNSGDYELELFGCGPSSTLAEIIAPQTVHVTAPRRTGRVATSVPAGATIDGTVLAGSPATGGAAAGACVEAYSLSQNEGGIAGAALDGTFSITNLPPGQYQIYTGDPECSDSEPDLAPQWYLNSGRETGAATVSVSSGGTTTLSDSTLRPDGFISGAVTRAGGGALAGVCVAAIPVGVGTTPVYSVTGARGSYSIGDLPAGLYRVQFSSGCGASGYRRQFWNDKPSWAAATVVRVRSGATTEGIGATLQR